MNIYGPCPQCGASWDAGPIPEEYREHYSKPFRYSRVIGVEYPEKYDGIWEYRCPDCSAVFPSVVARLAA